MQPNFTGVWKLIRGECDFGFLPPPRLRVDTILHNDPQLRIRTRQKDANGDITIDRDLTIGGEAVTIQIRGRAAAPPPATTLGRSKQHVGNLFHAVHHNIGRVLLKRLGLKSIGDAA